MSTESVMKFFDAVYGDKELQGALNYALVKTSPDVVIAIAKEKGYTFDERDLNTLDAAEEELSAEALDGVVGGNRGMANLSNSAFKANFLNRYSNLTGIGNASSGFSLTIPGPSFVNQQSFRPVPTDAEAQSSESVSAVELFAALAAES